MGSNFTKEEFESIVKSSKSISECLHKMGVKTPVGNYKTFHRYRKMYDVDISHFKIERTGANTCGNKTVNDDEYLVKNGPSVKSKKLIKILISLGLKEYKCEKCGISDWNGMPIALQIHHIDGDSSNNEAANLQILCPNCHSQTDNFCGKNRKETERVCKVCGKKISRWSKSNLCPKCSHKEHRKAKWPSREELVNLLKNKYSFVAIGKMFGVSDNAVKKWCKSYSIDYKAIRKPL